MIHEIENLDTPGLRRFALTTGAILGVLFGAALPWLFGFAWPLWPWIVAGVLGAWGLVAPGTLGPVYRTWMRFGLVMGWVMSRVVLSIVFFLLVTPIGFIMRLTSHDPMRIKPDKSQSFRVASQSRGADHMEKPF